MKSSAAGVGRLCRRIYSFIYYSFVCQQMSKSVYFVVAFIESPRLDVWCLTAMMIHRPLIDRLIHNLKEEEEELNPATVSHFVFICVLMQIVDSWS